MIFYEVTIEDCRNNDCIYFVKESYIRQSVIEQSKQNVNNQLNMVACDLQWGCWGQRIMTSSDGNIFRVTGPLYGEFTGHRWIPLIKANFKPKINIMQYEIV